MDALSGSASPEIADPIKKEYHGNDHFSYLSHFLYSLPDYSLCWIPDTERNEFWPNQVIPLLGTQFYFSIVLEVVLSLFYMCIFSKSF